MGRGAEAEMRRQASDAQLGPLGQEAARLGTAAEPPAAPGTELGAEQAAAAAAAASKKVD